MIPQQPDAPVLAVTTLVVVFTLLDLVAVAYALSMRRSPEASPSDDSHSPTDTESGGHAGPTETVECPSCGTENEADYRYCRRCVTELPGHAGFERQISPSFGGFAR
jgi:hypothetical protein